jgi:hypothetical protein
LRREEIKEIVQYYEYGYLPSMDDVTKELTTWQQVGAAENKTWYGEITLTRGGQSGTISFNIRYPATGAKPATGWPAIIGTTTVTATSTIAATGNNAYYFDRGIAVGNVSVAQAGGSGQSGTFPSRTGTTLVTKLYSPAYPVAYVLPVPEGNGSGYGVADPGDRNAPSNAMQQVWGFSRGLDGFELAKDQGCEIDTNAIAQTGTSIGGKMALLYGAFDERVLLTMPVASGAAGAAIERFVSPTVNATQSKDRTMTGWMPDNRLNKAYQYIKIYTTEDGVEECIVVLPEEALRDPTTGLDGAPTCVTTGGSAGAGEFVTWSGGNAGAVIYSRPGNNVREDYGVVWYGWQVDEQKHESYQTITDYRTQYGGGMFNSRFREFINLYPTLNTTHIFNTSQANLPLSNGAHRSEIGYLSTQPFDQHYLTALVAPRGLYITVGVYDSWTNPEGMFLNFLAAREVYRLLGKEKNVGYRLFVQQHTTANRQLHNMADALVELHKGNSLPADLVPDGSAAHPYTYTLADPRSKFDYLKLDWAAPGHTSIADQVKALIP